ncbi:alcohol dehydrogenase catalytic domain-containing protein [Nonomuraea sp. NPDC049480]|uniref:alcohol dehydrogenase catalytic domain-containing protein n=1 Tax=Nonomuraea sp. NPDC049480 TaxID=3364353 RepID=UPI0037876CCF
MSARPASTWAPGISCRACRTSCAPATGLRRPRNPQLGIDVAGEVEAAGANVTGFKPGDRVFGTCDGAYAEYARTPRDRLGDPGQHHVRAGRGAADVGNDRADGPARRRAGATGAGGPGHRRREGRPVAGGMDRGLRTVLQTLAEPAGNGNISPVVEWTYPLSDVPEAVREPAKGHARGKMVITVQDAAGRCLRIRAKPRSDQNGPGLHHACPLRGLFSPAAREAAAGLLVCGHEAKSLAKTER